MSYKSELDPLLPENEPAPEIQGFGFSKYRSYEGIQHSEEQKEPSKDWNDDNTNGDDEDDTDSVSWTSTKAALNRIGSLFTIVVFIGFVVALLNPRITDQTPIPMPKRPPRTIAERVFSILDGTPLIDGHVDLAIYIRGAYKNKLHTDKFKD